MAKPKVLHFSDLPLQKLGEGVALKRLADQVIGARNIGMGWIIFKPGSVSSMHAREVEEFIYVIKGEATIKLDDGDEHKLGPGDCIIIPPGTTHQHMNNTETDVEQIYIFAPQGPEESLIDLPVIDKI